jgi:hypothetical protein
VSAGPDDIGRLVKQLREAGINQPIVGGDSYDTPSLLPSNHQPRHRRARFHAQIGLRDLGLQSRTGE